MKGSFLIFATLFFISCSSKHEIKNVERKVDCTISIDNPLGKNNQQGDLISEYIDTCFYIPLSTKNEYIGEISKIQIYNDTIFILDKKTKSFFIFDWEGKLINRINSVGKGPNEYILLSDFTINRSKRELILLDNVPLKCMVYSFKGEYKYHYKLNLHANKFICVDDNSFVLYNNYNGRLKNNLFNVFFTDYKGNIKNKAFPFEKKALVTKTSKWDYFFQSDKDVFLSRYYDNTIYMITKDTIIPHVYFDFGSYKVPDGVYYKDYRSIDRKYVHTLTNYFELDKTKVVYYTQNNSMIMLLLDKASQNMVFTRGHDWKSEPSIDYCYFPGTIKCTYEKYFCTPVDVEVVKNRLELNESNLSKEKLMEYKKSERINELLAKKNIDNPILFFYRLKNF